MKLTDIFLGDKGDFVKCYICVDLETDFLYFLYVIQEYV